MAHDEIAKTYSRMPEAQSGGGYSHLNKQLSESTRDVMWDLIRQFGKALTAGRPIISISLPVRIMEPRSYLQRIADGWIYATYLSKAAQAADPVERIKFVVTFALSGFNNTCYPFKPFNPILGETYEAAFDDGTKIMVEQSSHHPPITSWEVYGKDYNFYGYGEWTAFFRGNSVKGHQKGAHVVEFKDGSKIVYGLPFVWARGMIYGERIIEYEGPMDFVDEKNDLKCHVKINTGKYLAGTGGWFSMGRKRAPSDYFEGTITQISTGKVLSTLDGTWLGCVNFDGVCYWDWRKEMKKYVPTPLKNCLPSDCRHRKDMRMLAEGLIDQADEMKVLMEEDQRRERKLREEGARERHQQDEVEMWRSEAATSNDEQPLTEDEIRDLEKMPTQ